MSWAKRLRRLFANDIDKSGGLPICTTKGRRGVVGHGDVPDEAFRPSVEPLRIVASIGEPIVIARILDHCGHTVEFVDPAHPG